MKVSVTVGSAYYDGAEWHELVQVVQAAERLGAHSVWSAEAWGMDAVVSLAYLAGVTERIRLGSGIMQISARTPAATAMTALAMDRVSNGRFSLGLGVSGPQVVEGLHGASFAHPLGRLREYVDIVRLALNGERIRYQGRHFELPRPGGEGKALKTSMAPRPDLPIYLATLGPKSLELTGEIASGWLGTSFVPEHSSVFFDSIRRGAERAGREFSEIDIQINAHVKVSDDLDALLDEYRPKLAFSLGGMGSATTNFYNDAFARAGYEDACAEVQRLWVGGDKTAAAAAVPAELVFATNLIGTEAMVFDRIRAHHLAGVHTLGLRLTTEHATADLDRLEMTLDLVDRAAGG